MTPHISLASRFCRLAARLQARLAGHRPARLAGRLAAQLPAHQSAHLTALLLFGLSPAFAASPGTQPLCALLTSQEVVALAPFKIPFVRSEPWPLKTSTSGCRYVFESADAAEAASIAMGVTAFGTAASALAHFDNTANDYRDLWQKAPQMLATLGDKAWFGGEDETGLKIIQARMVADVNMRGLYPDVTAEMKQQSSIALGRLLLMRLERLKLQ